jgi:threonine dehydrogenase-like Zn-dependent dehydrogenase
MMRALVLNDQVEFQSNRPDPQPAPGEVLVKVTRYMGFRGVLGHEFVGVAQSGPMAGRRVVGEINCACWRCATCRAGLPTHCPNRTVLGILNHDGAFADSIAVPQKNLHAVPDSLPDDVAVFTEPVAAAFQIPAQLTVGSRDRIVVLGDGRLGNLCAQVLAGISSQVLVVGKHTEKLAVLKAMGISTAVIADALEAHSADIVVDCTGSDSGLPTALRLVRPRGTIVLKTTVAGEQTLAWAPFVIDEVTLVGSRCGPFDKALDALEHGRVQVKPLIADRFDLSRSVDALARARTKGVLKVLLDVN